MNVCVYVSVSLEMVQHKKRSMLTATTVKRDKTPSVWNNLAICPSFPADQPGKLSRGAHRA